MLLPKIMNLSQRALCPIPWVCSWAGLVRPMLPALTHEQCDDGEKPALRHPVRTPEDRPSDRAEPILSGAPLHGHGHGSAREFGAPARDQGRRRLGRGQYRILLN